MIDEPWWDFYNIPHAEYHKEAPFLMAFCMVQSGGNLWFMSSDNKNLNMETWQPWI